MLDARPASAWPTSGTTAKAAGMSEPELLLYRSNLLGADKRITNYGGGNTSAKVIEKDPLTGEAVEVLWVKGSGGDVGTMKLDGFATLYMAKLEALKGLYRGPEHEDEMVGYLPHCTFNLNPRAASIDTPLHAYVPRRTSTTCTPTRSSPSPPRRTREALTREIFGDEIGWLPWKRPGYELGLWLEKFCRENPDARGVVLESHGLFTWGDDAEGLLRDHVEIINRAIDWLEEKTAGRRPSAARRTRRCRPRSAGAVAATLMPRDPRHGLEGRPHGRALRRQRRRCSSSSARSDMRAARGARHLLPRPFPAHQDPAAGGRLRPGEARPRRDARRAAGGGRGLPRRLRRLLRALPAPDSPALRDPNAVVFLVPGVGMITFAKDKATARISGEFYVNAINVMRGASAISEYRGLPEQEAFDIEYWLLEEAKLQRMPKPKSLAGRIALVTGGAGGIGAATAERLLARGRLRGARRHRRGGARGGRGPASRRGIGRTWCGRSR